MSARRPAPVVAPADLSEVAFEELVAEMLRNERLERAIGVIYQPQTERQSHYFHASLSGQFDAVVHFNHTRAVQPLERLPLWEAGEPAETWPTAL